MAGKIELVAYNDDWPFLFSKEAERVKSALGENCYFVHHIGSTVVPGLPAKPIIDMLPIVGKLALVEERISRMEALGYTAEGEQGLTGRRYFEKKNFHVHVYQFGDPAVDRHVKFCDYLKIHPDERDAYARLKIKLAKEYAGDREAYQEGKQAFIRRIEKIKGLRT